MQDISLTTTPDMTVATRQSLQALYVQRQSLEQEGQVIVQELTSPGEDGAPAAGIDHPLIDPDGYPRGDIDVFRVRSQRGRLAEIRTDHTNLTADIERHLQQMAVLQNSAKTAEQQAEYAGRRAPKPKPKFDAATGKWVVPSWDGSVAGIPGGEGRSFANLHEIDGASLAAVQQSVAYAGTETSTTAQASETWTEPEQVVMAPAPPAPIVATRPFARVDAVAAHSPAEESGLLAGDLILQFGTLTVSETIPATNPFAALADVVPEAAADQRSIDIHLERNNETMRVQLTPRPWNGRGLIGCHIVPYDALE